MARGRPPCSCELEQRWRRSLASLLFFTIILTNNFGLSSARLPSGGDEDDQLLNERQLLPPPPAHQCLQDAVNSSSSRCPRRQLAVPAAAAATQGCALLQQLRSRRLLNCNKLDVWFLLNSTVRDQFSCAEHAIRTHVRQLQLLDRRVGLLFSSFSDVVSRFDCNEPYSVTYTCDDCKEAYLDWLCSMYLPYYSSSGRRLQPCRGVCGRVQLVCPYFLPSERPLFTSQYAGEPSFLCQDPMISDMSPFTSGSMYGHEDCCLHPCCLNSSRDGCTADSCQQHASCPAWGTSAAGGAAAADGGEAAADFLGQQPMPARMIQTASGASASGENDLMVLRQGPGLARRRVRPLHRRHHRRRRRRRHRSRWWRRRRRRRQQLKLLDAGNAQRRSSGSTAAGTGRAAVTVTVMVLVTVVMAMAVVVVMWSLAWRQTLCVRPARTESL